MRIIISLSFENELRYFYEAVHCNANSSRRWAKSAFGLVQH